MVAIQITVACSRFLQDNTYPSLYTKLNQLAETLLRLQGEKGIPPSKLVNIEGGSANQPAAHPP